MKCRHVDYVRNVYSDHKLYPLQNIDNIKVCFHTQYNYDRYNIMSYYYYLIAYALVHNMIITTVVTNSMNI